MKKLKKIIVYTLIICMVSSFMPCEARAENEDKSHPFKEITYELNGQEHEIVLEKIGKIQYKIKNAKIDILLAKIPKNGKIKNIKFRPWDEVETDLKNAFTLNPSNLQYKVSGNKPDHIIADSEAGVVEAVNDPVNYIPGDKLKDKTGNTSYAEMFRGRMLEAIIDDDLFKTENSNGVGVQYALNNIVKWILIIQFEDGEAIDKSSLQKAIEEAPNPETDELYYHEDDRYKGKEYECHDNANWYNTVAPTLSRWQNYKKVYEKAVYVKENSNIKEQLDLAEKELKDAIKTLIPKNEVNATNFYEKICKYSFLGWIMNYQTRKEEIQYLGRYHNDQNATLISDEDTVDNHFFRDYKAKIEEAQQLLEKLYLEENVHSEYNIPENKDKIEAEIEEIIKQIEIDINGLEPKIHNSAMLINLSRAYRGIDFYANELFNNQTDEEYLRAREEALQFLETNPVPSEGLSLNKAKSYFDMYEKIRAAYQGMGKRLNKKIRVNISYVDATQWQGSQIPGFPMHTDSNNCLEKREVELDIGKTTVLDLFEKFGKTKMVNGQPIITMGPNYGDNGFASAIYINGIYHPGKGLPTEGPLDVKGISEIELNDGDEVMLALTHYPQVLYFEGFHGIQQIVIEKSINDVKYQKISLLNDNIKMGEGFKIKVEAKNGDLYNRKKGEAFKPLEDFDIYISQPYATEEEARNGKLTRLTGIKTDENGEADLKLYEEGWYILNSFKDDVKFWKCSGPSIVFQIQKSDNIEAIRAELNEKLQTTYEKLGREHFSDDKWIEFEAVYKEALEKLKEAKTGKDMADAVYPAVEKMEKLQKEASTVNENNLKYFYYNLNRFPDNLDNMDAAATEIIAYLKESYEKMTDYQRGQLSPISKEKYDTIIEKSEKGLPEAKEYNLSMKLNLDSVDEADREGLTKILDELRASKPVDDVLTPLTGGIPLAELFTFNTTKEYKNGVAFDSFNKHKALSKIVSCVNPDYVAYLKVRDKDPNAKFNIFDIGGGKISDEYTTIDLGSTGSKDEVNARLLGKMAYIVNDHEYEIKDIKVSGVEKYTWENIPFYEQSFYKGKNKNQCNMYVLNTFASFEMPFEDVEIEVIFGSKYGDKDQIESAKISAKASIESAFYGYKKESYEDSNWKELLKYKEMAIKAIDEAGDIKAVNDARNEGLSKMATVKKKASEAGLPSAGEPDSGPIVGKVYTSVENTTFPGGAWTGRFLEGWYDFGTKDTMMTIILKALKRAGYSWNGTGGTGSGTDDYTITYLAYIYKDENKNGKWDKGKEPKLGEFDGEGGSGWMGTLNDWFTNFGFQSFSYANGWLTNNDVISVQFTQNLGVDLGGTWGNSDTRLKDLKFSKGKLVPEFSSDVYTYDLILPSGSEKESIVITPTAMNKNYLIKAFLNLYNDDSSYYKRPETMGVKVGDTIYVGCGDRSWPSMNKQGDEARYYVGTKYTIRVQTSGPESVAKRIAELPEAKGITMNSYNQYEDRVNALYQQYQELSAKDKAKIKPDAAKKLKEVYEQIKFFSEIGKVKDALKKIPEIKKGNESAIKNAKADIDAAAKLYKALSDEQKKYITVSDAKKFNNAVEWLKAHGDSSIAPIIGTPDKPEVETNKEGKNNVTVTKTEIEVVESTATITLKDINSTEMIKQAKEHKSYNIVLDAKEAEAKADRVVVQLTKKVIESILKDTESELEIRLPETEMRSDRKALKEIISQAKGDTITIEIEKVNNPTEAQKKLAGKSADVFTLKIKSNNMEIHNFGGGKVTVRKLIPNTLLEKKIAAVYLKEDGTREIIKGTEAVADNMKYYEFQTTHFSAFAIVDADEAGIEVEDTLDEEEVGNIIKALKLKVKTKALKKSIKISVKVDKEAVKNLKDKGYKVKYAYYCSTQKGKGYKNIAVKAKKSYIDTKVKRGKTYYYKVALRVYDGNGKLVAKTLLKDCKYRKAILKKKAA